MSKYLTKEGFERIKNELDHLKTVKRRELAETLKLAASFGDLSENFAYHQAKEDQGFLEGRIREIESIIRNAKIIEKKGISRHKVEIGSVVWVSFGKEKYKFQIVGGEEADPTKEKISAESPLGKAILDKGVGEKAYIETPDGKIEYQIIKIE